MSGFVTANLPKTLSGKMKADCDFGFGPFRLDVANARLLCDGRPIAIKPKVFDVLAHLVRNAGRLVSQEELLESVWPETIVGDSSLKSCIRQIRQVLGDDARRPRFIETLHRRGYTFIAPVAAGPSSPAAFQIESSKLLVGRDRELAQLHELLEEARDGQRRLVFITGGPGSGKTAVSEIFLRRASSIANVIIASGQCFEQFGSGEPYLPMLDALGRLGRGSEGDRLKQALTSHASTWLAYLPALRADGPGVASATRVAPPERMLREMAEALERFTTQTTLILFLEDLHWADHSTLDLLSALARRREPARLMILATYRPVEAVLTGHPLRAVKQDLQARGLCRELALGLLNEDAVTQFLAARFPDGQLPGELAQFLHEHTEGLPLFLVNLIDDWLTQGILKKSDAVWRLEADLETLAINVPASIRALIEKQLERLTPDELQALEAASVAGVEFSAAAATAALGGELLQVEESCESLTRRHHFLVRRGVFRWPDGTESSSYRFSHELVHRVVSEAIPGARRRRLHQQLAVRVEAAYGARSGDIAPELALHFDSGMDPAKAVYYLQVAADRAARQFAHREAIDYLRRGLAAIERLSPSERIEPESRLQLSLGVQLQVTGGFADTQARRAFARGRELADQSSASPQMFSALWGLWLYHKARSELATANSMAQELLVLAEELRNSSLVLQAHQALAVTALCLGEPAETRRHMELANELYDRARHHVHTFSFGQDPGVACRAFGGLALWLLGEPDRALETCRDALRLSHELVQPSSQALALHFTAMVHQCRREGEAALACADLALTIAAEEGHSFWKAGATVMRGWALAECRQRSEGIELMRQGIESCEASGNVTYCTYYLALLAEALGNDGQVEEGLAQLDRAEELVQRSGERLFESEVLRLRGELILRQSAKSSRKDAERQFRKALAIAKKQRARSLELRARESLGKS